MYSRLRTMCYGKMIFRRLFSWKSAKLLKTPAAGTIPTAGKTGENERQRIDGTFKRMAAGRFFEGITSWFVCFRVTWSRRILEDDPLPLNTITGVFAASHYDKIRYRYSQFSH